MGRCKKRVYLAHDIGFDRDAAFCVIKTEGVDGCALAHARREAQAMSRLGHHRNIMPVFDIGSENGQPYFVSHYVTGCC